MHESASQLVIAFGIWVDMCVCVFITLFHYSAAISVDGDDVRTARIVCSSCINDDIDGCSNDLFVKCQLPLLTFSSFFNFYSLSLAFNPFFTFKHFVQLATNLKTAKKCAKFLKQLRIQHNLVSLDLHSHEVASIVPVSIHTTVSTLVCTCTYRQTMRTLWRKIEENIFNFGRFFEKMFCYFFPRFR